MQILLKEKVIFILNKTDFAHAPSAMDFTYSFSHIRKCQDMYVYPSNLGRNNSATGERCQQLLSPHHVSRGSF